MCKSFGGLENAPYRPDLLFRLVHPHAPSPVENWPSHASGFDLGAVMQVTRRPPNRLIPSGLAFSCRSSSRSVSLRKLAFPPGLLRFRSRNAGHSKAPKTPHTVGIRVCFRALAKLRLKLWKNETPRYEPLLEDSGKLTPTV